MTDQQTPAAVPVPPPNGGWRDLAADQNLRLAQAMLDRQGDPNDARQELADSRAEVKALERRIADLLRRLGEARKGQEPGTWAAAYQDAARYLADDPRADERVKELAGLLVDRADSILLGEYTPWVNRPLADWEVELLQPAAAEPGRPAAETLADGPPAGPGLRRRVAELEAEVRQLKLRERHAWRQVAEKDRDVAQVRATVSAREAEVWRLRALIAQADLDRRDQAAEMQGSLETSPADASEPADPLNQPAVDGATGRWVTTETLAAIEADRDRAGARVVELEGAVERARRRLAVHIGEQGELLADWRRLAAAVRPEADPDWDGSCLCEGDDGHDEDCRQGHDGGCGEDCRGPCTRSLPDVRAELVDAQRRLRADMFESATVARAVWDARRDTAVATLEQAAERIRAAYVGTVANASTCAGVLDHMADQVREGDLLPGRTEPAPGQAA